MKSTQFSAVLLLVVFWGCSARQQEVAETQESKPAPVDTLRFGGEEHIRSIRQLTRGGENAEVVFFSGRPRISVPINPG